MKRQKLDINNLFDTFVLETTKPTDAESEFERQIRKITLCVV